MKARENLGLRKSGEKYVYSYIFIITRFAPICLCYISCFCLETSASFFFFFHFAKVWSDYKNNCKKKCAKISRAASGTGGGPALQLCLTDLENRVMQIVGVQAATGMAVQEAGFNLVCLLHYLSFI